MLNELIASELGRTAPPAAQRLVEHIVERHGRSCTAVLFYGSCLRRDTPQGVMDFYALVDDYRSAYSSRALAFANAMLPPNVFYLELESPLGTLRSKYAVVSMRDFERGVRPGGIRSGLWARFCQPALAAYVRDSDAGNRVTTAVAEAVVTAVARVVPLLCDASGAARFDSETLWLRVLNETYASEWRTEAPETIRSLYDADPPRYLTATRAALTELAARGEISSAESAQQFQVQRLAGAAADSGDRARGARRAAAKFIYFFGLLKSAVTFGDWLPYALWKLERHTGRKVVLTDRQRRHPFIWGWPVLWRVVRERDLR